jgi:hypothetical protein
MPVSETGAKTLREIKKVLEQEVRKEGSDAKGIHDRVVKEFTRVSKFGLYDIELRNGRTQGKNYSVGEIHEVGLRAFARYCFYFLKEENPERIRERITKELETVAQTCHEKWDEYIQRLPSWESMRMNIPNTQFNNWVKALDFVSYIVEHNWGTPLEVVE